MKSSAWSSLTFLLAASLLFTLCSAAGETERHEHHERRELHARASANLKNTSDKVHGIIMSVTVVLIFPLGAMSGKLLNRVFSPRSLLWIHVGCQVLGLTLLVTGFGVGVWVAILHTEVYNDPQGHAVLGTIIVGLFIIQPVIGMRHHQLYKAGKASRVLHQVHIWFGRILIILAIANGGTGIFLAGNAPPSGQKAYGTLAGIIGAVYIVLGALWYLNRTSNSGENSVSDPSEVERGVNREVKGPEVEGRVVEMVGVL